MATKFSDSEIEVLLQERKLLPGDYKKRIQLREKRGHKERTLEINGEGGNMFRLILRQSSINVLDFSIILAVYPTATTKQFRLKRYNGKSHEHTNHIEEEKFYAFHVHTATERYQELGSDEDAFAVASKEYSDFHGALKCMVKDCGFVVPEDKQKTLF